MPQRDGLFGREPIRSLGEWRHDRDDAVGVVVAQGGEEFAHTRPDVGYLGWQQIAMAGNGDDERDGVAALARSTRGALRRRGERNLLDLTGG